MCLKAQNVTSCLFHVSGKSVKSVCVRRVVPGSSLHPVGWQHPSIQLRPSLVSLKGSGHLWETGVKVSDWNSGFAASHLIHFHLTHFGALLLGTLPRWASAFVVFVCRAIIIVARCLLSLITSPNWSEISVSHHCFLVPLLTGCPLRSLSSSISIQSQVGGLFVTW